MADSSGSKELFEFNIDQTKVVSHYIKEQKSSVEENVKVEIAASFFSKVLENHLKETVEKVDLKGFRPGKAPLKVVQQKYGAAIEFEATEKLIDEFCKAFLKSYRLATTPRIENLKNDENGFIFDVAIELIPEIEIKDWKTVEIENPTYDINDKKIEDTLEKIKNNTLEYEKQDDSYKAKNHDKVEIDFEGFIDGEAFAGGKAENHQLLLGSNTFIPGFEEQLIGLKSGDSKVVKVKFPEDYGSKDHAGKDAEFKIFVHAVLSAKEITYDDEWTKNNFNIDTLSELKEKLKEQIDNNLQTIIFSYQKEKLFDELHTKITAELPKTLLEKEYQTVLESLSKQHKDHEGHGESCQTKIAEEAKDISERRLKLGFLISKYQETSGVTITQGEVEQSLMEKYLPMGEMGQQYVQYIRGNKEKLQEYMSIVMEDKIVKDILSKVSMIDKKMSLEEVEALSAK
jgi:trigger factor